MAHCAADLVFLLQLLHEIGLNVKLPMTLKVDSKGAKLIGDNWSTQGRTKHIDIRHHFLRELRDKKVLECLIIPGESNLADFLPKNVQDNIYLRHLPSIISKR